MTNILRAVLILLLACAAASAQGTSSALSVLKVPTSALQAALGGTAVTRSASLGATSANPASMVYSDDRLAVLFTHASWIQGISSIHLTVALPTPIGRAFLTTGMTTVPDIEVRTQPGPVSSTFSARTATIGGGWGTEVSSGILLGLSASYIYDRLYTVEASGFGFSAGLLATSLVNGMTVGASVSNLGSVSGYAGANIDLPRFLRFGASYTVTLGDFLLEPAVAYEDVSSGSSGVHIGASVGYGFLRVHGGLRTGESAQTAAFGASVAYQGILLDYALVPFSSGLGSSQLITLALSL